MYAPERYRSIVERVRGKGRASVSDLAEDLSVTPETIRRDLSELERQGLVRRVHGGAVPAGSVGFEASVDSRDRVLVDEKNRIAKAALSEVPEAGAVIIALVGTNGISMERGLTTPDQPEAAVKRAMLISAKRKVILADHTKFGDDHFAQFGSISDIDVVITDKGVDQNFVLELESLDIKVVQA